MNQTQHPQIKLRGDLGPNGNTPPEEDDDEIVSFNEEGERQGRIAGNHFTKNGAPDRRYKGQRDLPEEEVRNVHYTHPAAGSVDEKGIHRTSDGKPDRRYLENRALTARQALVAQAKYLIETGDLLDEEDGMVRDGGRESEEEQEREQQGMRASHH